MSEKSPAQTQGSTDPKVVATITPSSKKVTLTLLQVAEIYSVISNNADQSPVMLPTKFSLALTKTRGAIRKLYRERDALLTELNGNSDLQQVRINISEKYCERKPTGEFVYVGNQYKIEPSNWMKFEAEMKKAFENVQEVNKEERTITIPTWKEEDCPEHISAATAELIALMLPD